MYFSSIFCNEKHQLREISNTFIENQKLQFSISFMMRLNLSKIVAFDSQ